jgi:hypothetical protein
MMVFLVLMAAALRLRLPFINGASGKPGIRNVKI